MTMPTSIQEEANTHMHTCTFTCRVGKPNKKKKIIIIIIRAAGGGGGGIIILKKPQG